MQARLFKRASEEKIPSFFFVKAYAASRYVLKIDDLTFVDSFVSEDEIFEQVKNKVKTRRGVVYDGEIMSWIGYLLREWSYRYGVLTSNILKKVDLAYLSNVYSPYHSLDILKAIEKIAKEKKIDLDEDSQERLRAILIKTFKPI